MGTLADADAEGQEGIEGAGPYLKVYLKWEGDKENQTIGQAWFETYGCPTAIACGSWLMQWVEGKTKEQAQIIEPRDLELVLGGLPLGKEHCAGLAVKALRGALLRSAVSE
jgi:NifU-like protein